MEIAANIPDHWAKINPSLVTIFSDPRIVAEFPNLPGRQGGVGEQRTYDQQVDLKNRLGNGAATPGYSYYETGDALDFYGLSPEQLTKLNQLAQVVAAECNVPLTWGGDWAKRDYVHFQVPRSKQPLKAPTGLSVTTAAKNATTPLDADAGLQCGPECRAARAMMQARPMMAPMTYGGMTAMPQSQIPIQATRQATPAALPQYLPATEQKQGGCVPYWQHGWFAYDLTRHSVERPVKRSPGGRVE